MNLNIKKLTSLNLKDFVKLIKVFETVFEMEKFSMPDESHLQKLLERDDFLVFAAIKDNEVVGGLTAYTLHQYYSEQPLVYIYDLAVKTEFQRQGIGKKLIAGITDHCKKIGIEEIFVQADLVDKYAIDFYRSTGARHEEVVHFYYPLN